eukprot:SAG22_NODE_1043_length_5882_cov_148.833132_4_plen_61_part_00
MDRSISEKVRVSRETLRLVVFGAKMQGGSVSALLPSLLNQAAAFNGEREGAGETGRQAGR